MFTEETKKILKQTDIYLFDQILKERYRQNDVILDAGCGLGRNLQYFYVENFEIHAVDSSAEAIKFVKQQFPKAAAYFHVSTLENMTYPEETFHHIICNAVLHFAESEVHFKTMFSELIRVLKKGGSLFIRMTSDIGMEGKTIAKANGVHDLPDGTERFLLTRSLLNEMLETHHLQLLEPVKSTVVNDVRSMTTLVFQK